MVKVESYITKKIARRTLPKLYRFKARLMVQKGREITDSEAIDDAFDIAVKHAGTRKHRTVKSEARVKKQYRFEDLAGMIKGGPKFNADEEIDKVVYGV